MNDRIGWRALARYFAGESSPEEAAGVDRWARSDARHAELLESARRAWAAAPASAEEEADVERGWQALSARIEPRRATRRPAARRWLWGSAAAAAVAALMAVPLLRRSTPQPEGLTTWTTAAAQVLTVRLADGSVVRLAPETRLRAGAQREVWLEGTAFFAVAKAHGRPFTVHTAAGDARVLGTRFELRAERSHLRLAVLEGRVALTGDRVSEVVTAGQVSTLEAGRAPTAPRPVDVSGLTGWMQGVLIFQATPLTEAAAEIERQYGVPVRVDPALGERTVTAVFDHQPLNTVATSLCRIADATCDVQDSVVSLRP